MQGFEILKFSGGELPQIPLDKVQPVTLIKPAGYFNFYWNPWISIACVVSLARKYDHITPVIIYMKKFLDCAWLKGNAVFW